MQCRDAQFYLRLRRHAADELGADVAEPLDAHLAACPACAADARVAQSFDRALATAMRAVPLPAGLHDRLIAHAAGKRGATLRRRGYRYAGLVAASLLFVSVALGVFSKTRPTVDTDALVREHDKQWQSPQAVKESTRVWLTEQKLPDTLPLPFDYDLLVSRGFEQIEGRYVPVLVFRAPTGSGIAKVYLFREDGRFNLKELREAQMSGTRAEVIVGKDKFRGATYVIIHTGPNLMPFYGVNTAGVPG